MPSEVGRHHVGKCENCEKQNLTSARVILLSKKSYAQLLLVH